MKTPRTLLSAVVLVAAACNRQKLTAGASTCATVESLHPGVEVVGAAGNAPVIRTGRVEIAGRVRTAAAGRAVIRTDDGLELRVAGDSEIVFADGRARVERGKVFVSSWGDGERSFGVGSDAVIRLADAALAVERAVPGTRGARVIAVRGEVSYQQGSRQGQLAQGESLEGDGALAVQPAGVWDDWTGGAASPQGVAHRGSVGAGRMVAHVESGEAPTALAINEHKVTVRVAGDMAVTTVQQRFFNGSERAAAVEYRLRVPDGAVVSGFRVEQGGAWVTAQPATVASTARGGGLPGLLASPQGEVFATLGVLSPGDSTKAEITYVEWLSHEGGHRAYVYPMGDPVAPQIVGEFVLDVDVSRALASSVRPPEGARLEQDQHVRMRRSDWKPRGDLVIDLADRDAPATPSARAWRSLTEGVDGYRHLMVDLTLPAPEARGTDLAIVLDESAATDPASLEIARAAVDAILHQVGPEDRVALLLGDLGARAVEGAAGRMEAVTDARREAILDAIAHARSGGASDLGRMIVEARGALDPSRNGAVLYIGDATPTVGALDPARLADETSRQAPDLRLYVIALGASSHPEVLRPLTDDGGMTLRVDDQSEAVTAAHRVCAHALRPCLRDVRVNLGDRVSHPLPSRVRAWVAGDPLRVVGELTGRSAPNEIVVDAREGATARRWTLKLDARDIPDQGDLARRWAGARIDALALTGGGRASIAELGARYGVVTPVSALVLGPAGWNSGGAGSFAVTDSPWPAEEIDRRLPQLGVAQSLTPRGVQSIAGAPESPIAVDDDSGWQPHAIGENRGADPQTGLSEALANAAPAARACVDRKRALRPGLGGDVLITATVDATGRVVDTQVTSTTMGDGETEGCIRRAVQGVTLPAPELLGARAGNVSRWFHFEANPAAQAGPSSRVCASSAQLPRSVRKLLWRERLASMGPSWQSGLSIWRTAMARCELRWWEDRVALLEILLDAITDPSQVVELRINLDDPGSVDWLDAAIARRFGPAWVWRAHNARAVLVDWDSLLTRLASPTMTDAQKITLVRAYLAVSPRDVDLRLRLMALLEASGQTRDARTLGERLRRDPLADARVRGQVAELLLRAGDRTEALRAFTEIAEFAPYDPFARGRLGDLLLTYGWPTEAYHHYQTLAMLRPSDPLPLVRVALAALASGHEDEGLRLLRRSAEEAAGDASGRVAQAVLDAEVSRVAMARPDDAAVRAWLRVATRLRSSRETEMAIRWTHPDLGVELLSRADSETGFTAVGETPSALGVRVWSPDTAFEGTHLVVRAPVGIQGARVAEARVQVLAPTEAGTRLVERVLRFDRAHRAWGFVVRNGALVDEAVVPAQVPAMIETLE